MRARAREREEEEGRKGEGRLADPPHSARKMGRGLRTCSESPPPAPPNTHTHTHTRLHIPLPPARQARAWQTGYRVEGSVSLRTLQSTLALFAPLFPALRIPPPPPPPDPAVAASEAAAAAAAAAAHRAAVADLLRCCAGPGR